MIKIKFIKNYVSLFFFIELRTITDLYGGHSANVRKSSSELTTRAPVLLFCKIKIKPRQKNVNSRKNDSFTGNLLKILAAYADIVLA